MYHTLVWLKKIDLSILKVPFRRVEIHAKVEKLKERWIIYRMYLPSVMSYEESNSFIRYSRLLSILMSVFD